jgi:WD40 repeat protein
VRTAPLVSVRVLQPGAPPELAAIAERAMRRDPAERYPSARELAADVARYVDGRRVHAYDYSSWELVRRLARAWRAPLLVGAAALVVVAVLTAAGGLRLADQRNRAVTAEAATRVALTAADRQLAQSLVWQARVAQKAQARAEAEVLAAHALKLAESPEARGVLAAFSLAARPRVRSTERAPTCVRRALSDAGERLLCLEAGGVSLWSTAPLRLRWRRDTPLATAAFLGPDRVALTTTDGQREIVAAETGATLRSLGQTVARHPWLPAHTGRRAVAFDAAHVDVVEVETGHELFRQWPCGLAAATAGALSWDDSVLLVACSDGRFLLGPPDGASATTWSTPFGGESEVAYTIAFAPDGRHVVAGTTKGRVAWLDAASGAVLRVESPDAGAVHEVRVAPDGALVAARLGDGGVRLWQPDGGGWVTALPARETGGVAFGADTRALFTVGADVRRWDLPEAFALLRLDVGSGLTGAEASPDGAQLAATAGDGSITVAAIATGRPVARLDGRERGVLKRGAFSPDGGTYVASFAGLAGVAVYDARSWWPIDHRFPTPPFTYRRVGVLGSGLVYAVVYGVRPLQFWRLDDGVGSLDSVTPGAAIIDASTVPGGEEAVLLDEAGGVYRLRAGAPRLEHLLDAPGAVAVDASADGARLAVAREDAVLLFDAAGRPLRTLSGASTLLLDVAVSGDGRWIAAGGVDGTARVWAADGDAPVAVFRGHGERVSSVAFEGSEALITASWDGTARRWGIGALARPAAELAAEVEAEWGLTLDEALAEGR